MSTTIPLIIFVISIAALIVMVIWIFKGVGNRRTRIVLTAAFLLLQVYSWIMLVVFGAAHQIGLWAAGLCLITAILAFCIPAIHKKLNQK